MSRTKASWEGRRAAESHFAGVASRYQSLRDTDHDAVIVICDRLPQRPLLGVDVGAGTGRYSTLLQAALPEGSSVIAADLSHAMLRALEREAADRGPLLRCAAEQLPLADRSVEFVTTFNAVHHFDLDRFAHEVDRVLASTAICSSIRGHPSRTRRRSGVEPSPTSPLTRTVCTTRQLRTGLRSAGHRGDEDFSLCSPGDRRPAGRAGPRLRVLHVPLLRTRPARGCTRPLPPTTEWPRRGMARSQPARPRTTTPLSSGTSCVANRHALAMGSQHSMRYGEGRGYPPEGRTHVVQTCSGSSPR